MERHLLVENDNAMYDSHFYAPYRYTHQFASWVPSAWDGGSYPDPDRLVLTTDAPRVLTGDRVATPSLPASASDCEEYDSGLVRIGNQGAATASPQVVVEGGMGGTARFDSIGVTEYGPDDTEIREVLEDPLDEDSTTTWYPWTGEDGGDASVEHTRESSGHRDGASPSMRGTVTCGAG